jgi:transcriptional regulator with XRE-family HTH domain
MILSERLKAIREQKNLSQGDIEAKTGLLRGYISRVENGHTVPSIETLEKMARALDVPMYQLFYEGRNATPLVTPKPRNGTTNRKDAQRLSQLSGYLSHMKERDKNLLVGIAAKMAR